MGVRAVEALFARVNGRVLEIGRGLVAIGCRAVKPLDQVLLPVVVERRRVDAWSFRVCLGCALALVVQTPKDSSKHVQIQISWSEEVWQKSTYDWSRGPYFCSRICVLRFR